MHKVVVESTDVTCVGSGNTNPMAATTSTNDKIANDGSVKSNEHVGTESVPKVDSPISFANIINATRMVPKVNFRALINENRVDNHYTMLPMAAMKKFLGWMHAIPLRVMASWVLPLSVIGCWHGAKHSKTHQVQRITKPWQSPIAVGSSETWNGLAYSNHVTMSRDALHYGNVKHRELHNAYGYYFHMATSDGLLKRGGVNDKPFVLSRAFFPRTQRLQLMMAAFEIEYHEGLTVADVEASSHVNKLLSAIFPHVNAIIANIQQAFLQEI
ncbi:glycosyl hydrolases family 31 protein [Artemisia annua]|uniref:Glycosyl hydrolases family 31 protein n=1 Tax=Artemisia annua TaxID=35608 RepID=A0A2U1LN89_ARTAN|nr:glycosyl hydrolases family 31 protein [Artemisia annua]